MDRRLTLNKCLQGLSAPALGLQECDHNIQTSSSLNPLGQLKPNFMGSILREGE